MHSLSLDRDRSGKLCFPTFVQALSLSNSLAGGQHHDWRFTLEITPAVAPQLPLVAPRTDGHGEAARRNAQRED